MQDVCGALCEMGEFPLVSADFFADDAVHSLLPVARAGFESSYPALLRLPLHDDNQSEIGALCLFSAESDFFSSDDIQLLERFGEDLSNAIRILRARKRRERQWEDARAIHDAAERERRSARAAAEEAQRAFLEVHATKNAFLANLTHEIRTPLTAILGFAELIATETGSNRSATDRDRYLEALERNSRLLSNIINDLLDLATVAGGKLEVHLQNVPLREILTDLEMLLGPQAQAKDLAFQVRCEPGVPLIVRTDRMRLLQILLNVVGNAIKFTAKGSVEVAIKLLESSPGHGAGVAFVVHDTGSGMNEHEAAKLFEPFSQADTSLKRCFGGPGIGLVLARRMCEMLSGTVELTKTAPGHGSTFTITLADCLLTPAQVSAEIAPAHEALPLAGLNLLLVDDSPDIQVLVARYLKLSGASVEIAGNGKIAVEMARAGKYDQILMDIQMPVMNGYEAVRAMRGVGITLPITALTAHSSREERQRCMECGFNEHLAKPINRITLVDRLARLRTSNGALATPSEPSPEL